MALHARQILAPTDSQLFGRVLQCPVFLTMGPDFHDLLVSSRDAANRSRILIVRLEGMDGPSPRLVGCRVLLEATDVDPDCVGLMSGDVIRGDHGAVLVGNAYHLSEGRLSSRLFTMPLDGLHEGGASMLAGEVSYLWPDDEIFRATPAIVIEGASTSLVYSRTSGRAAPDGRFPSQYHLASVPLKGDLEPNGEERPLIPGEARGAWAKPAQDPDDARTLWFCHRGVTAGQAGYQLGRMTLDRSGVVGEVDMSGNGGWGDMPADLGMLAYPEPLPGGDLIACTGDFGSAGLVLLAHDRVVEPTR